jgi:hypothetical protein
MGVPIYQSDFPTSAEPLTNDVFLGLPLTLVLGLGLIALALMIGAYFLGRSRVVEADRSEAIWKAISDALKSAVGAPRDQVVARGRALSRVIEHELGPVLLLVDHLGGAPARLTTALGGRGAVDEDHAADPAVSARRVHNVAINASKVTINTLLAPSEPDDHRVSGDPEAAHSGGHGPDHGSDHGGGHGHETRALNAEEQIAAVREAVHALSDHWSEKAQRMAELRAVRRRMIGHDSGAASPRLSNG